MAGARTDMHKVQELVRLHRSGLSGREVARRLRISPNTERCWRERLKAAGLLEGPAEELVPLRVVEVACPPRPPPQQVSSLSEPALQRLEGLVKGGAGPKAAWDRMRLDEPGFQGSLWSVKRACRRWAAEAGPTESAVAIRVHTPAGQVAQVDFGYAGELWDPVTRKLRRAWVFVMVLAYSRHLFAKVVFDQSAETWVQLHVEAFAELGGVPATLVPDNLKAAVTRAAFGASQDPGLSRSYRELARHYGFSVDPTPPRSPQKKGKVERAVQMVKRGFFSTVTPGEDVREVNAGLRRWTVEIAGTRTQATTGRAPLAMFQAEEQGALLPLPLHPYEAITWKKAKVHRDAHVQFDGRFYSVPWRHLGEEVWVRATPYCVEIMDERHVSLHVHERHGPGVWSTVEAHLPAARQALSKRLRGDWEAQARAIGPQTAALVEAIFASDDAVLPLRRVQSVVGLLQQYPKARAEAAAERARAYGAMNLKEVRNILNKALDLAPIQPALFAVAPAASRFARPLTDIIPKESR